MTRGVVSQVLQAFETFGTNVDDYLHLVVPAVVRLIESQDAQAPVRAMALQGTCPPPPPFLILLHLLQHLHHLLLLLRSFVFPSFPPFLSAPPVSSTSRCHLCSLAVLGRLCLQLNFSEYASRIILPLARVLRGTNSDLQHEAVETLCSLVLQLGSDYAIFVPMINKVPCRSIPSTYVTWSYLVRRMCR